MRKPLLFLPGPMQVPDFVRPAADRPMFNHRSVQMDELMAKLEKACRPLFGSTSADVQFVTTSGTGVMESAIANMTSPGDEAIVIVGGTFSQRWSDIASAFGLKVHTMEVDWRRGAMVGDVEQALAQWPNAEVVFITWSESSTGVLIDLNEIGQAVRAQNKYLIVDAVSGLAVSPMEADNWKIDAVVVGSQKGLMVAPGLAVVAIGPRAWDKSIRSKMPRFYFDWKKYRGGAVPFTPAITLLFQLEASLDYIHAQGLGRIFERHASIAEEIRNLVHRSGMEVYALRSGNGITGVIPPPGFDIDGLKRRLERDFGIQIAGGLGHLKGKTFRIGHVGHVTDEELDYFIQSYSKCLAS
jgi:aspartate aminotransferase-like enzyme